MGLNIKNREAHLMAEELSKLTGENMTTAVTTALRERLARVRQEQGLSLADRLLAIGRDCAARLKEPVRSANHGDLLFDERGSRPRNRYPVQRAQSIRAFDAARRRGPFDCKNCMSNHRFYSTICFGRTKPKWSIFSKATG